MNRALSFFHGGSLEITLTVPLNWLIFIPKSQNQDIMFKKGEITLKVPLTSIPNSQNQDIMFKKGEITLY